MSVVRIQTFQPYPRPSSMNLIIYNRKQGDASTGYQRSTNRRSPYVQLSHSLVPRHTTSPYIWPPFHSLWLAGWHLMWRNPLSLLRLLQVNLSTLIQYWCLFYVVSLFTKVPVDLVAKVAHKRLVADTSLTEHTSLSPPDLLKFCLGATYVSYKGEAYQQTCSTAMGSPVSVTVANLVIEKCETASTCHLQSPTPLRKRYVDDTLTTLSQNQIQQFH